MPGTPPAPDGSSRAFRARGTSPALPGFTQPTAIIASSQAQNGMSNYDGELDQNRRAQKRPARRAVWKLLALGVPLALLFLALYPLLNGAIANRDAVMGDWFALFPWLPRLFWTAWQPALHAISRLAFFDLAQPSGNAHLLALVLIVAAGLVLLAARIVYNATRERLLEQEVQLLAWIIGALTVLFAALFLFAPAMLTQDGLLYGLYGRLATVYHANPYTAPGVIQSSDIFYGIVTGPVAPPTFGPIWMDVALAVALTARDSLAHMLLDVRLLAAVVHLANTLLIWKVLARLRPEMRFAGTVLYGWNPVVLLLGIAEMHLEVVVILCVLLAAFFFQHRALLLAWVSVLLAALISPLALLLFPLFLRLLGNTARIMPPTRRFLWWSALLLISTGIVVLAYLPYYTGWSVAGIGVQLRSAFVPGIALNSLAAALQHLNLARVAAWLAAPLFWSILAAVVAGALLALGLWLADNLAFTFRFLSWVMLAWLVLSPLYQPWFALLPLALALCSADASTIVLAMLLSGGALLSYLFALEPQPWAGQGLVAVGLPFLIWGWSLFFSSTWHMTRSANAGAAQTPAAKPTRGPRLSRPGWPSRPAWPSRK